MNKGTVLINWELCKGCGHCIKTCPSGVLALGGVFNKAGFYFLTSVSPEKCSGCALCAEVCPEIAIEVYRESR